MDKTDIAILNTTDNEELSDYFTEKEAGEECTITLTGKFLGLTEGNARISIEDVEITAYDEADEDEIDEDDLMDDDEGPTGAEMVLTADDEEDEEDA